MSMADLEGNKRTVVEFYELAFNGKQPEQAVERSRGLALRPYNPQAPDGPEAFIGFVKRFPRLPSTSARVLADGDIVVTHSLVRFTPDDRGTVRPILPTREWKGRRALGRVAGRSRGEREPDPHVLTSADGAEHPRSLALRVGTTTRWPTSSAGHDEGAVDLDGRWPGAAGSDHDAQRGLVAGVLSRWTRR
jgi:predicted SnoaL-like aldol condensation-catalyzing enzyme